MGKGVGQIARRCRELRIPCIGLAGVVTPAGDRGFFTQAHALTELTTVQQAKAQPAPGWSGWPGRWHAACMRQGCD